MDTFFLLYKKLPFLRKILIKIILKIENGTHFSKTYRKIYKEIYGITIGEGTYGGCFNRKLIPSGTHFGRYCSIGPNVQVFRANHPVTEFTSHPILYNPIYNYVKKDTLMRPEIFIGNDVWIGASSIILPNVKKIGNGSVIGAGSVVTKDIGEFEIWVGNPAKKIGDRFDEITKRKILSSCWWDLNIEELVNAIPRLKEMTKK